MEKNLIKCPIDNKNLMEDAFEDGVFDGFMAQREHRKDGFRLLFGIVKVYDKEYTKCLNYSSTVEAFWCYGKNFITIKVLAVEATEDFNEVKNGVFEHYKELFKDWENEDGLTVRFVSESDYLHVLFYWDLDKC